MWVKILSYIISIWEMIRFKFILSEVVIYLYTKLYIRRTYTYVFFLSDHYTYNNANFYVSIKLTAVCCKFLVPYFMCFLFVLSRTVVLDVCLPRSRFVLLMCAPVPCLVLNYTVYLYPTVSLSHCKVLLCIFELLRSEPYFPSPVFFVFPLDLFSFLEYGIS